MRFVAGFQPRRPWFEPGLRHMGFVVEKAALERIFLITSVSFAKYYTDCSPSPFIIRGWYSRPNSGRRTKWTQSHLTPRWGITLEGGPTHTHTHTHKHLRLLETMRRNAVGTATILGSMAGVQIPSRERDLSVFHSVHNGSGTQPASYRLSDRGSLVGN
jgi:hypothetical protein